MSVFCRFHLFRSFVRVPLQSEEERQQEMVKAVSAKILDLEKEKAEAGNVVEQEEEEVWMHLFFVLYLLSSHIVYCGALSCCDSRMS